ncbi:Chemotaxis protein CheW [Burkholderiaceae bacterium]|nr:Chemotaxis protein CheW [Burkholderiaceae bacterium]
MSKVLQLVGFRNGDEFFGVPISKVREIVRVPEITPVPDMPEFLKGVINLRGRIVAVVDMSRRLGTAGPGAKKANRVLILELGGSLTGLIVDSVSEIVKIDEESIEPPPEMISSIGAEYVTGVGKLKDRLFILLEIDKLMKPEEMLRVRAADMIDGAEDAVSAAG